jgi:hypothetical protein
LTSTGTPNAHVPYGLINQSYSGYAIQQDQNSYNALEAGAITFNMPFCTGSTATGYPPVAYSTNLPNTATSPGLCYPEVGVEFSITASYLGLDTSTPSGTSASVTTIFAAMANAHPTWTWGDVKAALRQTASNWSTGYAASAGTPVGFGYGNINYTAAVALTTPSTFYLQPPGFAVFGYSGYASLAIFPFQQSRRVGDAVYVFTSNPASAMATLTASNNQYTYAQVQGLGGTLIYQGSSNQAESYIYYPPASGTYYFVAFTVDNATLSSANFSRGEVFSTLSAPLTVSLACLRQ